MTLPAQPEPCPYCGWPLASGHDDDCAGLNERWTASRDELASRLQDVAGPDWRAQLTAIADALGQLAAWPTNYLPEGLIEMALAGPGQ